MLNIYLFWSRIVFLQYSLLSIFEIVQSEKAINLVQFLAYTICARLKLVMGFKCDCGPCEILMDIGHILYMLFAPILFFVYFHFFL